MIFEVTGGECCCMNINLFPASIKTLDGVKWGYINGKGQFALSPQFDQAGEFQENGLAIVWNGEFAGAIDGNGQFVIEPSYHSFYPYTEGVAVVFKEDQRYYMIDENGKILTEKPYTFISSVQENRAPFQEKIGDQYLYGYLDKRGKVVLPAQYEYAYDFEDGKALVRIKDRTFALIDPNGKQLHTYSFEEMGPLREGLLPFRKASGDKEGYINKEGDVVIPPRYGKALPFQHGRAIVNMSDQFGENLYGLIDHTGSFVIEPKYHDINVISENRVSVGKAIDKDYPSIGSIYAVADSTSGHLLTDFIFDRVDEYEGEYSSVTKGITSFFIKQNGKMATELPVISGIGALSLKGDLIQAFVDERFSYFDRNGHLVWEQNRTIAIKGTMYIREEKYRPNENYLIYYPQLKGLPDDFPKFSVNQTLIDESSVKILPKDPMYFSYSGDFSVRFLQGKLLVLELTGYEYPFGAAHGMPTRKNVHIDLETGQIFQLKDLFKGDSEYVKLISEIVEKKIAETPDMYLVKEIEIREDQPFFVTSDHLVIYFYPYEVAAYAFGFPEFEIPFEEIMSLIEQEGQFWKSFH